MTHPLVKGNGGNVVVCGQRVPEVGHRPNGESYTIRESLGGSDERVIISSDGGTDDVPLALGGIYSDGILILQV